jgi:hypothetical protein
MVIGQAVDALDVRALASVNAGAAEATLGVGIDSTTAPTGIRALASVSGIVNVNAFTSQRPSTVGRKTANALIHGTTTAPVFYGAHGAMQSGLSLDIWH